MTTQLVSAFGDGQFDILSHALFEVIGFSTKLLLNVLLELLSDVLLKAETTALKFYLEAGFPLLEALTKLLFKSGANTSAKLFLPLGQKGLMPLFKSADFQPFHFNKSAFHFLFEVGLNVSETLLQGLVVVQTQSFFLNGQTAIVFLVELSFNAGFHLSFAFLEALMLFNAVFFVKGLDLAVKSEVEFMADTTLFCCQSVSLHGFEFRFHRAP